MGDSTTKRPGFTLIEMLVVMAIIAVLAGFLFPMAGSMRERGNQTSCLGNLQSIGQGLKMYRLDERSYPPALYGFLVEGDTTPTTFLYPHYAHSRREFKCPNNPNRFDETKLAGPFTGSKLPNAVPMEKDNAKLVPMTDKRLAYYLFDSYDGGHIPPRVKVNVAMDPVFNPAAPLVPGYELHYRRDWASLTGDTNNADRELLDRNPEDSTYVTCCTYHRNYDSPGVLPSGPYSWDMVLFLDGHTEKVPSSQNGWTVKPRD
jgi:prepilin-type N-terminal cleavage/methylation domain-containing protein